MAITITKQIAGQQAMSLCTYCYLYEPLVINITESVFLAKKIYIDLRIGETKAEEDDQNTVETIFKYGDFDINSGESIQVDLMQLARQYHDANTLKIGRASDIPQNWESVVSKYKYIFFIYSDATSHKTDIQKLPIIGGRNYLEFAQNPTVLPTQKINDIDNHGLSLQNRWAHFPYVNSSLYPSASHWDAKPHISIRMPVMINGTVMPCGGFVIWKSRLGGWNYWGFDMITKKVSHKYNGSLDVGLFESALTHPHIEPDYTGTSSSYSYTLKSLSLNKTELKVVSSIQHSPAIYFIDRDIDTDLTGSAIYILELMRLSSASIPVDSQANGGNVSITLNSISKSSLNTR